MLKTKKYRSPYRHTSLRCQNVVLRLLVSVTPLNWAAGRSATQKRPTAGLSPLLAVDGSRDNNFLSKSCSKVKKMRNPWWKVNIGGTPIDIAVVAIFNRGDCCGKTAMLHRCLLRNSWTLSNQTISPGHPQGNIAFDNTPVHALVVVIIIIISISIIM